MSTSWCLPLARVTAADLPVAGGKAANLGELLAAGFDVPPGFVVTTDAYRLAVADLPTPTQESVGAVPVPPEVRDAVLAAYAELGGGQVAVRSSATAEDLPGAAFAGQQDTFLGVVGEQELLAAVRRCWASLWTERAISYRDRLGIEPDTVALAVVVQRMVAAEHAGVMFTANPVTGARDQVVVDSSPGLGEAVVAGLVTPDHAVVDARGTVIERRAGRRELVVRALAGGGTEVRPGDVAAAGLAPLGDTHLARLAAVGRRIETHFGRPQDIEWAVADGHVAVLQARPMTALPPAPIPLDRRQRFLGPVILELLPRRPTPLEVTAWIEPVIGRHLEVLLDRIAGARATLTDVLPTRDGVVQAYVPPRPQPTPRTPLRLLRTIARMRRDPRGWARDPRRTHYLADAARLAATDVSTADWRDLLDVPGTAARLAETVGELRAAYLPAAAGALIRLGLLLTLLRERGLLKDLVLDADTVTKEANAELAELARLIRAQPTLAGAATDPAVSADQLLHLVEHDPAAADVRDALRAFLDRYGHRETTSILLPRDPTWADAPQTVLALAKVLGDGTEQPHRGTARAATDRLLAHRAIRGRPARERAVRRLIDTAAAGIAVREDTHFEVTRAMPAVHRALGELGRRLATAGALDDADDVWYLTWPELSALGDPRVVPPGPELARPARRRRAAQAELAASPLIATTTLYPRPSPAALGADVLVSGVGGGGGRASGAVRLVHGPEEFGAVRAGEVLVCPTTNPSWTPLFARVAAVVVDHGGLASHAAIVAREYGIPAVMGSATGTATLADGEQVVVDGDRGLVLRAGGGSSDVVGHRARS